jgi:imidazole glycerol phosphate synthase glutamine amidotransferase subunit
MVLVIDYGIGNLASFTKALTHIAVPFTVSANPEDLHGARHAILIGVGHFGSAMKALRARGFEDAITRYLTEPDSRLIGICVGMQMLFEGSDEAPGIKGLSLLRGPVTKLMPRPDAAVPHVGFDEIRFEHPSQMTRGLPDKTAFYFTHSFAVAQAPPGCWTASCHHGGTPFIAAVDDGKVCGMQFHPEKSQSNGITMLRNLLTRNGQPA